MSKEEIDRILFYFDRDMCHDIFRQIVVTFEISVWVWGLCNVVSDCAMSSEPH